MPPTSAIYRPSYNADGLLFFHTIKTNAVVPPSYMAIPTNGHPVIRPDALR